VTQIAVSVHSTGQIEMILASSKGLLGKNVTYGMTPGGNAKVEWDEQLFGSFPMEKYIRGDNRNTPYG